MLCYNVTLKIDPGITDDWQQWMRNVHIPEMLETGLFERYRFCRLLEQDESDGVTFVVQYICRQKKDYDRYLRDHADTMRQKGLDRFGDQVVAFRTLMEVVSESGIAN